MKINKNKLIVSGLTVINIVSVINVNEVRSEGVILSPVGGELNLDEKFEYVDKCQRSGGTAAYSEYAGWSCLVNNNEQLPRPPVLSPSEQQAVDNGAYADDIFQPTLPTLPSSPIVEPSVIEKEDNQPSTTTKVINTLFDFLKVLTKPTPNETPGAASGGTRG